MSLCVYATHAVLKNGNAGDALRAFALVRPPGHHASRNGCPVRGAPGKVDFAEGGCFYNSVAAAAAAARSRGVSRVAVVDWDVHHGNGTEEIFYRDESVLYVTLAPSQCAERAKEGVP